MSKPSKQRGGVPKISEDSVEFKFNKHLDSSNIAYLEYYATFITDVKILDTALMHKCLNHDDEQTTIVRKCIEERINELSAKK